MSANAVRIVVPDDHPSVLAGSAAETALRALGDVTVFTERGADATAELARRIGDANVAVTIRASSRFNADVIDACARLTLISIWGTGTDNVDMDSCARRKIVVANTPGVNANSVAEHTMALMLAVTRRIPAMDRETRAGTWPRGKLTQLEGCTLGIVGLGAIGRRVAALAAPFGMRLLASTFGPEAGRASAAGARAVSLEELLRESDIVSLHLRLSAETTDYIDRERLALMKRTAFLINTARAALVERTALIDALAAGEIAGAGLDVFHEEPLRAGDALAEMPNVVLTPHNAGMTQQVIDAGLARAVDNVRSFLGGEFSPAN